jgi:hypothetical protein
MSMSHQEGPGILGNKGGCNVSGCENQAKSEINLPLSSEDHKWGLGIGDLKSVESKSKTANLLNS